MTLQEFSRDIVPIIQMVLTALGLLSIVFVWWQIKQTNLWNKLRAEESYLRLSDMQLQKDVLYTAKDLGIDLKARTTPITGAEAQKIWDDDKTYAALLTLLNNTETIAFAMNAGKVDMDVALEMHGFLISHFFEIYEPFIQKVRDRYQDDHMFLEMEKIKTVWLAQQEQRKKGLEDAKKMLSNLRQKHGVPKKA